MKKLSLPLIIVLILGASLRLYRLSSDAIWYDEACSVSTSLNELNTYYFFNTFSYKPLYFLFLKAWIYIFGIGEFWLRLPSVIFSVLSLLVIYRIGQKILNEKTGLIAAFLLAISCFNIYHSQQARHFTLMVLLVSLSYLYFINILKENTPASYKMNTFLNAILIFVHPYSLVVIITQNIFMLFLKFKENLQRKRWIVHQGIVFSFIVLWVVISNKIRMLHNAWWINMPNLHSILETFETFSYGGPRYGLEDFRINFSLSAIILILFYLWAIFFIIGLFSKYNKEYFKFKWTKFLLIFWLFIPIAMAFFVSSWRPVYLVKHFIIVSPAFYLIVALGIYRLKRKPIMLFVLILLFFFNLYPLKIIYSEDFNVNWGEAAAYLKLNAKSRDAILISTCTELPPFLYYFSSSPKYSLKDIDADGYAKLVDGKLSEVFYERDNLIIGIRQNQKQVPDFVKKDFVRKINSEIITSAHQYNNIWLAISRWTHGDDRDFMVDYLNDLLGGFSENFFFNGITLFKFNLKIDG